MRYQLAIRPMATASGQPGEWSISPLIAESAPEMHKAKWRLARHGYESRPLPIGESA